MKTSGDTWEASLEGVPEALTTGVCPDDIVLRSTDTLRRQNALRPVNSLPEELLVYIFQIDLASVLEDESATQLHFHSRRINLAGVSFSWRESIDRTPSFWKTCSPYLPIPLVQECLRKSGDSLIAIKSDGMDVEDEDEEVFWALLGQHVGRWSLLEAETSPTLLAILHQGAPLLEELDIWGRKDIFDGSIGPLFLPLLPRHAFPRTRSLWLGDLSLPWSIPPFSNLLTLNLTSIEGLSFNILLKLLEASPQLKKLLLTELRIPTAQSNLGHRSIRLAEMQKLEVSFLDPQVTKDLLSVLAPTCLRELAINVDESVELPYEVFPLWIQETTASIIRICGSYTIEATEEHLQIISGLKRELQLFNINVENLEWWINLLHERYSFVPRSLHFGFSYTLDIAHPVMALADSFRSVTHLTVPTDDAYAFFEFVCTPLHSGEWNFPSLSSLGISGVMNPESIEEVGSLATLLDQRFAPPTGEALESFIYDHYEEDTGTLICIDRIVAGIDGCRVYRRSFGTMYEEVLQAPHRFHRQTEQ